MVANSRQVTGPENDWRNLLITELHRTGGDPSVLFEILEGIMEQRAWESLKDENGEPVGSLRRLIVEKPPVGCGMSIEKMLQLLKVEHRYEHENTEWRERMLALKTEVFRELDANTEIREKPGRPPIDEENVIYNNLPERRGTDRTYTVARLQRDNPELAQAVLDGELSANAAAIQAGWRDPMVKLYRKDLSKTAKAILHHLEREQVIELIFALDNMLSEDD